VIFFCSSLAQITAQSITAADSPTVVTWLGPVVDVSELQTSDGASHQTIFDHPQRVRHTSRSSPDYSGNAILEHLGRTSVSPMAERDKERADLAAVTTAKVKASEQACHGAVGQGRGWSG